MSHTFRPPTRVATDEEILRVRFTLEETSPLLDWIRNHESDTKPEVSLMSFYENIHVHAVEIVDQVEGGTYDDIIDGGEHYHQLLTLDDLSQTMHPDAPYSEAVTAIYLAAWSARELAQGSPDPGSTATNALDAVAKFQVASGRGGTGPVDLTDEAVEKISREQELRWDTYQATHPIERPNEPSHDATDPTPADPTPANVNGPKAPTA